MSALNSILGTAAPRMMPIPPKQRRYGLQVGCRECGCKLTDPAVEITLLGVIEKNDHMIAFAKDAGWISGRQGSMAWIICPACQKKDEKAQAAPLEEFAEACSCPKCGAPDTAMTFCAGCTLAGVRGHLHRTCPRCKYTFMQACKDEVPHVAT